MEKETFEEILKIAPDDAYFVGKADDVRIEDIERRLEVKLPESYKLFLKELGGGGVSGVEFIGNGLGEIPYCVKSTMGWRPYGLPASLVVVEDEGDDWIYCLDTSRLREGECPVVDWEQGEGIGKKYYETFLDFFKARIEESLSWK